MLAAAPDTPAPRHATPSPTQHGPAASSSATQAAAASTGPSVQQRQEAEAEGTAEGAAVIVAVAASGAGKPPAAAGEPTAAAGKAGTASTAPVAPNPHDSPSSAAGAAPDRLPSSPPNAVTMSRGASTTASPAAAGGSSSSDAAAGSYGVDNSEQSALSPPQRAAAAAAGAAAAEAAAVTALPAAAAAAAAAGKKGAAGSAVAASPTAAAAADAILLHKKKLVAVNNPVKLQAIRLLGILGESPACLLIAPGHAWVPPCWQLAHTASSGQPLHIPPSSIFLAHHSPAHVPHLCCHCTHTDCCSMMVPPGQNEQVRIALGQPAIRGRGLRVLAMDGGGMKVGGLGAWARWAAPGARVCGCMDLTVSAAGNRQCC